MGRPVLASGKTASDDPRARLEYDDAKLLAECEVHTFRASGPGGQKRNKTSSAVRLHHRPTGLIVRAAESRSQHENKARALKRLREAIAVSFRRPLQAESVWPSGVTIVDGTLRVGAKNPNVIHVIALALDAVAASAGHVADAAGCLGVSSSSLTRFLSEHHAAWAELNRMRREAGLPPCQA